MTKIFTNLKTLEMYLLVGIIVPVTINAFSNPAVKRYFIASAGPEFIAQIDVIEQALSLLLVAICLFKRTIPLFIKAYLPMSILAIALSFTVAILGPEYIEARFYIKALTSAIVLTIIKQGQQTYICQLWTGNDMRDLGNKLTLSSGLSVIIGAGIATQWISCFSIDELLWVNAIVTLISMIFNYILFRAMRSIVIKQNNGQDVI